jgi:hypothetical protein
MLEGVVQPRLPEDRIDADGQVMPVLLNRRGRQDQQRASLVRQCVQFIPPQCGQIAGPIRGPGSGRLHRARYLRPGGGSKCPRDSGMARDFGEQLGEMLGDG